MNNQRSESMYPANRIFRYLSTLLSRAKLDPHAGDFRDLYQQRAGHRRVGWQSAFTHKTAIDEYFGELQAGGNETGHVIPGVLPRKPNYWTEPTEEDTRLHGSLNERLAAVHREGYGLRPTLMRFLRGIARMPGRGKDQEL